MVDEKVKIEAICYTIAGLLPADASRRLETNLQIVVSPRRILEWMKDRKLRRKALVVYNRAVQHARANRHQLSKREIQAFNESKDARRIAARNKTYRAAVGVREAEEKAQRKVVFLNRRAEQPQIDEEVETTLTLAERLIEKFGEDKVRVKR